jgi:hypothetical protein
MRATVDLLERDQQLDRLRRLLEDAAAGRGGVVLVGGEAGCGKTQLVRAAFHDAELRVLAAEATQEAREPYAPVARLVRAHMRHRPALDPPELALLLPELAADAGTVTGPALLEAVSRWFAALGEEEPTAVFLDDVQWADGATIDLLARLAADLEDERVLLVGAFRSDEITRAHPLRRLRVALRRAGRMNEVEVPPLSAEGTAALAERVLGRPPSAATAAALYDRTQGVPLFVEELAAVVGDAPELGDEGHGAPLPDTIRDTISLRTAGLDEAARAALAGAAVLGLEFELDLLDELGVGDAIDDAVALGLVVEARPRVGAFRHALVREAIYLDVPWSRRRELHRLAASALEARDAAPRLVAEHWLAAGERERARAALLAAADASCAVYAYRDAAAAIRPALELWPDGDRDGRLDAIDRLARCAERAGDLREASRLWDDVLAELEPGSLAAARTKSSLALVQRLLGHVQRSARLRIEAAEAFEAAEAWAEAFELRLALAWASDRDTFEALLDALSAADLCGAGGPVGSARAGTRASRPHARPQRPLRRRVRDRARRPHARAPDGRSGRDLRGLLVPGRDRRHPRRLQRSGRRARGGDRLLPRQRQPRRRGLLCRVPRQGACAPGRLDSQPRARP